MQLNRALSRRNVVFIGGHSVSLNSNADSNRDQKEKEEEEEEEEEIEKAVWRIFKMLRNTA